MNTFEKMQLVAALEGELAAERAKTKALTELVQSVTLRGPVSFLLGRADVMLDVLIANLERMSAQSSVLGRARELRADIAALMKDEDRDA